MTRLIAFEPSWVGQRMTFLGSTRRDAPVDLYVWEPKSGAMGRVTTRSAVRHSLAVAPNGRMAFVEVGGQATASEELAEDRQLVRPGPQSIMGYEVGKRSPSPLFEGGWIRPGGLAWSPDGRRLAFITQDPGGADRLALLEPGTPLVLTALDRDYQLNRVVGWLNAREVLLQVRGRVNNSLTEPFLLVVGKDGIRAIPGGTDPQLSPDGRWILDLAHPAANNGTILRAMAGGSRLLNDQATAFAWGPGSNKVFMAVEGSLIAVDLLGKELKRWPDIASLGISEIHVSSDEAWLACIADFGLSVVATR